MYRLLSAVTAPAAAPGGLASSCGRRGVHQRAGLPPLGHGWVGGLGLGLGLALGVKLAGGLRGAAPAQPPAAPDPEASPLAEPPQEQSLAPWSPQTPAPPRSRCFARAIESSRDLLHRIKDEVGAPGIVVGVSVDGKEVWSEGLGYADVENRVPCKPETVMRIASISKSLTMVALAKLWEAGKLDLDIPVQHYVPEFPEKEYEGEKVSVTTRLLISHLSGIRHYEKDMKKVKEEKAYKALKMMKETVAFEQEKEGKSNEKNDFTKFKTEQENEAKCRNSKPGKKKNDFEQGELYLKEKFENSIESLKLFKNDPLFFKPGSQFLYSTFGYTLLAAIVERASGCKYLDYMQKIFHDLDMLTTVQEENEPVIYNRARFYVYNKKKRLVNTPYVDNSYKWAGGGFLSTVGDLLKFGNAMLYGYQVGLFKNSNENLLPGYLKPETMVMMWTPVPNTEMSWDKEGCKLPEALIRSRCQHHAPIQPAELNQP
ncbi:serine beta-lactamase-like protein LACTB, mitochondrial isoform X3 [Saimiri boliviensis]|uniref:serine beta-lactamase-like protein LACTB, mitochondrial isoform X3 n=1 Tax=Saimiri boliviensis TaxID=27679 RepID=UPI003D76A6D4